MTRVLEKLRIVKGDSFEWTTEDLEKTLEAVL